MSFDGSEIMARPGQTLAEHSRAWIFSRKQDSAIKRANPNSIGKLHQYKQITPLLPGKNSAVVQYIKEGY